MTDADIDALLATGDHEAAAYAAAELADPVAYRKAMQRCYEASKCKSATDFISTISTTPDTGATTMMQWTRQVMKLTSVNVRRELAGKNPADGRVASDLVLTVKGGNDILDKLSPHLRGSFYMADVDKQGVLVAHALTKRIHPLLEQGALAYDLKCAGYAVTIDHAGNDESAIVLDGCQVNNFRLNLEEGGTVAITMRVQFHPDPGQLDPLSEKLQQEVIVTMVPPKVPVEAVKREPDLVDAATVAETAEA